MSVMSADERDAGGSSALGDELMSASNDQIYDAILDLNKSVGGLEAAVKGNNEHIVSVSRKADLIREDLDTHKAEQKDAHGIGAERRGGAMVSAAIGAVLGACASAAAVWKALTRHG